MRTTPACIRLSRFFWLFCLRLYTPPTYSDHIPVSVYLDLDIEALRGHCSALARDALLQAKTRKTQPHKQQRSLTSFFQGRSETVTTVSPAAQQQKELADSRAPEVLVASHIPLEKPEYSPKDCGSNSTTSSGLTLSSVRKEKPKVSSKRKSPALDSSQSVISCFTTQATSLSELPAPAVPLAPSKLIVPLAPSKLIAKPRTSSDLMKSFLDRKSSE